MSNEKENLSPSEKIAIGNEELAKRVDDFFKEPTILLATLLLGIYGFTDELDEYRLEVVRLLMKLAEKTGIIPEGKEPDKKSLTVTLDDMTEMLSNAFWDVMSNHMPTLVIDNKEMDLEESKEDEQANELFSSENLKRFEKGWNEACDSIVDLLLMCAKQLKGENNDD